MNRTSIRPAGTAGVVPTTRPGDPDWDAIRTPDGTVFIHFYAGIWERLISPELAARFTPTPPVCCGQPMYRCGAEHTDGKDYLHCRSCLRNVEATAQVPA